MLIHHASIFVEDFEASKQFYASLLESLGHKLTLDIPGQYCGYSHPTKGYANGSFGISPNRSGHPINQHIGFGADSREQVDAFHKKALELGAKCNGKPGLRPQYGPTYYAAFVHDQDGNNIEAVYMGEA
ncbi:Glyoxalase/bleomycin resistance protein/dioxygenase [Chlamydoabsidia padenii]|nr:Glyoxalase/bleomycin resistance protein/dioxygenase [Chlamydoabsidia padenii]